MNNTTVDDGMNYESHMGSIRSQDIWVYFSISASPRLEVMIWDIIGPHSLASNSAILHTNKMKPYIYSTAFTI